MNLAPACLRPRENPKAGTHSLVWDEAVKILDEEKAADKKLSGLAEGGINQGAAETAHGEDDKEPVGAGAGSARKGSAKSSRR